MNFKRCFLFLICFAFFFSCNKNNKEEDKAVNDSIKKYIKLAESDIISKDTIEIYADKALSYIDLEKNDSTTNGFLAILSKHYAIAGDSKKYFRLSKIQFKVAIKNKDTLNIARFYRYRAGYYRLNNKLDSAYYNYKKAEFFYKKINDFESLSHIYTNNGITLFNVYDYIGAEASFLKAYKIVKNTDSYLEYRILISLGNTYHELKEYDKALKYFSKCLELINKKRINTPYNEKATCYNDTGNVYRDMGNNKQAIYYFKLALEDKNLKAKTPDLYQILLTNLSYCYIKTNKLEYAKKLLSEALIISKELDLKHRISANQFFMSLYFEAKKDTVQSVSWANDAVKTANIGKAIGEKLLSLNQLIKIDLKNASKNAQEYIRISDSINMAERKFRERFARIQFETDEIKQQKETAVKQTTAVIIITSTIVLLLLLLFVIFRQKAKQKELKLLQAQQQANEEIYQLMLSQNQKEEEARKEIKNQIALELHDSVMNKLASTRLNLFVLSKKNDEETIKNCLKHIDGIQEIENEIRNVSHNLHNEAFIEKDSFNSLLYSFINDENTKEKIKFELQVEHQINWDSIGNNIKMNLFRIIQEAVSNCYKHSKATNVIICFILDQNNLCLSISDNGIGIKNQENTSSGIGIKNMKTRIKELGGVFSIHSSPNSGTAIHLAIPIK